MITSLRRIKTLALEMRGETSKNDSRYEKLQDQVELCDDLLTHYVDDGR